MLKSYRFDNLGLRTLAALLLVGAWILTLILNGMTAFPGRGLFDGLFGILFSGLVSAGLYILVISLGFKRPVISGLILSVITLIGILAMPSYFLAGHTFEGNAVARVAFIVLFLAHAGAAVLYFISARTEKSVTSSP